MNAINTISRSVANSPAIYFTCAILALPWLLVSAFGILYFLTTVTLLDVTNTLVLVSFLLLGALMPPFKRTIAVGLLGAYGYAMWSGKFDRIVNVMASETAYMFLLEGCLIAVLAFRCIFGDVAAWSIFDLFRDTPRPGRRQATAQPNSCKQRDPQ